MALLGQGVYLFVSYILPDQFSKRSNSLSFCACALIPAYSFSTGCKGSFYFVSLGGQSCSFITWCVNPGEFRIFAQRSLSVHILPYVTCLFVFFAHVSLRMSLPLSPIYLLQILMVLFCLENVYSQFFCLLITFINVSFAIFMTSGYLCLSGRWHSCLLISWQAFYCFTYMNWALEHV